MERPERDTRAGTEKLVEDQVPCYLQLRQDERQRLLEMAVSLQERGLPPAFVASSLKSTAEVMREIREDTERPDNVLQREHVRRFIEQNAVPDAPARYHQHRERKREERDRLQMNTMRLIREARQARGRHEVKKTRSMLLKVDQRELRRALGREGEDLCRQINTWLRSTAPMF
jgi:hypothetical protein